MKKFLISVLVLALVLGLGLGGFEIYKNKDKLFPPKEDNNSSLEGGKEEEKSQGTAIEFGALSEDKTDGDSLKLKRAIENNRDTVAWLKVPGTSISAPVLQSYDNNFYLRKNENKESDIFGCYFADCDNNLSKRQELDGNIVIYGHSDLKDNPEGKRFSQLFKFTSEEFAKNNKNIILTLPEEELRFEVFSVGFYSGNPEYININSVGSEENNRIVKNALRNSLFDFGASVSGDDNIVVLSTCSVKSGTNYLAVMGKLIEN